MGVGASAISTRPRAYNTAPVCSTRQAPKRSGSIWAKMLSRPYARFCIAIANAKVLRGQSRACVNGSSHSPKPCRMPIDSVTISAPHSSAWRADSAGGGLQRRYCSARWGEPGAAPTERAADPLRAGTVEALGSAMFIGAVLPQAAVAPAGSPMAVSGVCAVAIRRCSRMRTLGRKWLMKQGGLALSHGSVDNFVGKP